MAAPLPRRPPQQHATPIALGYEIGPMIGRGGTSSVFDAKRGDASTRFALKVLTDARLHGTRAFASIYDHARRVAALRSPHVVRTFDAGRLATGEPYIVMEQLPGRDLAAHVREHGAMPVPDVLRIGLQVASALAEAHAAGILHEDLKPANLVLVPCPSGAPFVKLIDFGLTIRGDDPRDRLVTGSPGYASPEQLEGALDLDGRADVWALGVVLYELVTGLRAFEARSLAEARAVVQQPLPAMSSPYGPVRPGVAALVARCLEVDRSRRFAWIRDVAAALETCIDDEVQAARARAHTMTLTSALPRFGDLPTAASTTSARIMSDSEARGR